MKDGKTIKYNKIKRKSIQERKKNIKYFVFY